MKRSLLNRIEINPKVMLGKPVIRGTRITVELTLEKLAADVPIEEILRDYPRLSRLDVLAAIAYARQVLPGTRLAPVLRPAIGCDDQLPLAGPAQTPRPVRRRRECPCA